MTSQPAPTAACRPWLGTAFGVAVAGSWLLQSDARAQESPQAPATGTNPASNTQAQAQTQTQAETQEAVTVLGVRDSYQRRAPHLDRIATGLVDTPQTVSEIPRACSTTRTPPRS